MGYRSDVTIVCAKKAFGKIGAICSNYKVLPNAMYYSEDEQYYIMQWDWVKWYNDKGVEKIEDLLKKFSEDPYYTNDSGYSFKFFRIGENNDDTEEYSNNVEEFYNYFIDRHVSLPEGLHKLMCLTDTSE